MPRLLRSFLLWLLLLALVLLLLLWLLLLGLGWRLRSPVYLLRGLRLPVLLLPVLLLELGRLGRRLRPPLYLLQRLRRPRLLLRLLLPTALLLLLRPGDRSWSLGRRCLDAPRSPAFRPGPGARGWPVSLGGLRLGMIGLLIGAGSAPLRRRHLPRVLLVSLRRRASAHAPLGPLLPAGALAMMVPVVKILVIALAIMVRAPVGISLRKSLDILRMLLIPGVPVPPIPVSRPDNIGDGINVIRGPAMAIAVKIIQHAI